MRAVVQRVRRAKVAVDGEVVGEIGPGLLTLLGIGDGDTRKELEWLIRKIAALRIFEDASGRMNLSVSDVSGSHLIVSQFTLYGDVIKGNRPSFAGAARPEVARALYEEALTLSRSLGLPTSGGRFQAHMNIELENDGPVTIILESPLAHGGEKDKGDGS
jgi:D-tyrosyl-tRNA(Tyr) deacylase